jgi:hypothetical protein
MSIISKEIAKNSADEFNDTESSTNDDYKNLLLSLINLKARLKQTANYSVKILKFLNSSTKARFIAPKSTFMIN